MHIILKPIKNLLLIKNNKNQRIQIFFNTKTIFHQQVHLPVPCVNFTQITIKNLNLKNKGVGYTTQINLFVDQYTNL